MEPLTILASLAPLCAAGAVAYLAYRLLGGLLSLRSGAAKALGDYTAAPLQADPKIHSRHAMGSRPYRIALAFSGLGLNVDGWESTALYLAYGIASTVLAVPLLVFGFPTGLALAGVFVAFIALNAWIEGKWDGLRMSLEKEIPTLLTRLSSLLKANPNLIETLDGVAEGLDPEKPLKAWVKRLAAKLQAGGRHGLEEMQVEAQSISPSLLLAVVEIGRLWETGGQGYTEALRMASENMADLMETRSQAHAVAAGAWGTARTILLALGFTLGSVLVNPVSKPAFAAPLIQFGLLAAIAWAGLGYWQIRDLIAAVTD